MAKYTRIKTVLCAMIGMEIVLPNRASARNVDKVMSVFSCDLLMLIEKSNVHV